MPQLYGFQGFNPPIHLSDEDFDVITNNGELLDKDGQVSRLEFF
jgi:hypothetical protein